MSLVKESIEVDKEGDEQNDVKKLSLYPSDERNWQTHHKNLLMFILDVKSFFFDQSHKKRRLELVFV